MRISLFLFFCILSIETQSTEVWMKLNGKTLSVSEFRKQQTFNEAPTEMLAKEFIQANLYFEDNMKSHLAIDFYLQIASKAYLYDWPSTYRKSIAFSFLRLADHFYDKREFYLTEARKFASVNEIQESLFPKELFHEFKNIDIHKVELPIFQIFNQAQFVIINSRLYSGTQLKRVFLPVGESRIHIIRDDFEDYLFNGSRENFLKENKGNKERDWGFCLRPKISSENFRDEHIDIIYEPNCRVTYQNQVFLRDSSSKLPPLKEETIFQRAQQIDHQAKKENAKWEKNPNFKKYLWWGFGILAGKYLYDQSQKKDVRKTYQ